MGEGWLGGNVVPFPRSSVLWKPCCIVTHLFSTGWYGSVVGIILFPESHGALSSWFKYLVSVHLLVKFRGAGDFISLTCLASLAKQEYCGWLCRCTWVLVCMGYPSLAPPLLNYRTTVRHLPCPWCEKPIPARLMLLECRSRCHLTGWE